MRAEKVFDCDATLGEGACWDAGRNRLWWVDILGRRLFCGDPETGARQTWEMPTEIGACLPAAGGGCVLVLRDRVETFDPETGMRGDYWKGVERRENRFNDAGLDTRGNLWITSMDFDATAPTGQLWRLDPEGVGHPLLGGFPVLNGPVFAPDGRVIYVADTMNGQVLSAPHDPDNGMIGDPKVLIDLGPFGGLADGMAIDADGCLWLARITAGRVSRYAPDGRQLATFALPVPMVTSVAFGGPDLDVLFVTTARILLSDADLAAYPDSGSVFALRPGVKGLDAGSFGGSA